MFPLLCFLTGIGCAATPPPPAEYDPAKPIVVASAEQATVAEAERLQLQADAVRADSDRMVAEHKQKEDAERSAAIAAHQQREATRSRTTSPGFWNPAKGEKPSDRVVPPPARHCRTVVAAETQGRPIAVRQPDRSYRVGAEPVVTGTVPLEICDPPTPSR